MILRLLKGRGMVSGLFEKKRDAIPPHLASPQALITTVPNCIQLMYFNLHIMKLRSLRKIQQFSSRYGT
jgi:hypothetical protein